MQIVNVQKKIIADGVQNMWIEYVKTIAMGLIEDICGTHDVIYGINDNMTKR